MKITHYVIILMALTGVFSFSCQSTQPAKQPPTAIEKEKPKPADVPAPPETDPTHLNPDLLDGTSRNPIITHVYLADPTARVFEGRVYLYPSHDLENAKNYDMYDYHVFSSDDLVNWQDHGVVLDARTFWAASLYAPDCVYDNATKRYLLYYPNGGSNIGVAVSDRPGGPFQDVLGGPLISPGYPGAKVPWCFDPSVLIDDDGQAYLYFGGGMPGTGDNARVIRLNKDMTSLKDEAATTIIAPDYFEAPFVIKRKGKYYFTYSTNWEHGHGIRIDYLMSDKPMTGFTYKGVVIDNPPNNLGNNNHHSLVEYKGQWYVFYHSRNLAISRGVKGEYQRSVNFDLISFAANGEIIKAAFTDGVVKQLKNVNAFSRIEAELMAAQSGVSVIDIYKDGKRTGAALADLQDGNWSAVSRVDFGKGAKTITASIASEKEGGSMEIWIDGGKQNGGTLLGVCTIPATGGLNVWREISCDITPVAGVHNLYLMYKGPLDTKSLFLFDYYKFNR